MGRYAQAEPLFAEVLEVSRRMLGREHADTVICLNNLAWSLTMQGKFDHAEPLFQEALEIRRRTLGGTCRYPRFHERSGVALPAFASLRPSAALFVKTLDVRRRKLERITSIRWCR